VAQLEAKATSAQAAGVPLGKQTAAFLDFCRENQERVLADQFEYPSLLPQLTGFPVPYTLFSQDPLGDSLSWLWASLVFALVLASPVVVWQVWAFIAAGLFKHERSVFYRYFPFMMVLFAAGVLFGYFVALPYSVGFLIRLMDPAQVNAIFSIGQFLTLEFALTGALGLVFQLPLVMVALQRIGLVTHGAFVKNWRMAILIIFVVAAIVTPPEPVSMLLMSAPMVLLYGLGLLLTRFGRRHEPQVVTT
jgi:Tat protein translocase TatC